MSGYDALYKLFDKKTISLSDLRSLATEEHVSKVEQQKSDRWDCHKFNVTLDTDELYFVYVKKSQSELLEMINKGLNHN